MGQALEGYFYLLLFGPGFCILPGPPPRLKLKGVRDDETKC